MAKLQDKKLKGRDAHVTTSFPVKRDSVLKSGFKTIVMPLKPKAKKKKRK